MTARVYVIGHSGAGLAATCATACNHDSILVTPTTSTTDSGYPEDNYYITRTPDFIDYGFIEVIAEQRAIEEMKAGWLKPHKQLRPFSNNSKINYNLPRSRLREKKQIFLKAA